MWTLLLARWKPSLHLLAFGVVLALLLTIACASSNKASFPSTTTPAVAPLAAPATAPAPSGAPASRPAPTATASTGPAPLVAGGPPFDKARFDATTVGKILAQYSPMRLPLTWTKAVYGGELTISGGVGFNAQTTLDAFNIVSAGRAGSFGMLLNLDLGRCSMVGREGHFDTCNGKSANVDVFTIVPGLFESWTQPDPTTYLFKVRQGAVWPARPPMNRADRAITAEDLVWFIDITKREGAHRSNFVMVKSVEVVDRSTIRITLLYPYVEFLLGVADTSMGVFPKECYEEKDCLTTKHISPGPRLLTEGVPRGKAVWDRNPEFYLKGLPYLDRWSTVPIADVAAQKAAYVSGRLDTFGPQTLSEMAGLLNQVPGATVEATTVSNGGARGIFKFKLEGPLADVRVRRALAMTIDNASAWETVSEGMDTIGMLLPRFVFGPGFWMTLEQGGEYYQFNSAKAKALLTEAGYANGFALPMVASVSSGVVYDYLLYLQYQWKKHLGVTATIRVFESATTGQQLRDSAWEGMNASTLWSSAYPVTETTFAQLVKGSPLNFQKVDDPVINDLYLKQRGELDPAKRAALLWQFETYELTQIYALRVGYHFSFAMMPGWEINCVSYNAYYCHTFTFSNSMSMFDPAKYPANREKQPRR